MEAPRPTIARARALRRQLTPPEARLWAALRRKAHGLRFRRQHPVGPFVLDFYCAPARLAVEVDGLSHIAGDRPERDERRDAWLAREGIRVLRIAAVLVRDDLDTVIRTIEAWAGDPSMR
ncbi:endonuclease domain-containing protein [Phenylobacterium terrae]|uniref:Endonuclease domain-containing protein n=1 Tax=Phenylobacterium terrae TaxID=2665495 RepID=A0ABW4MWW3_9CAUL